MKYGRIALALLTAISFSAGLAAQETGSRQPLRLLMLFGDVLTQIRNNYVDPVPGRVLIENALNGMLTGLDPHSSYLTEAQWRDMQGETAGEFGGVGLDLSEQDGFLQVVSPLDGTPAARAGIRPGDLITAVNGKSVVGQSLDEAVTTMRGAPGTKLQLIIKRQGVEDPIALTLVRQIIRIETVHSRLIGDIGVIRISEFTAQTNTAVRAAIRSLRSEAAGRLAGLIVDLRNDPGGLLDQAIAVSNDFLDHGEIVSTRGRQPDDDESWSAKAGTDISGTLPIVVLTNNGTASAAEIVTAALQDNHRALVLGTRSFGKGSVQTLIPLPGHGAIRLTTARYYTPSGRSIQGLGVMPDVEVAETRMPEQHFGAERESDLRHILRGDASEEQTLPGAELPEAARGIPKLPPPGWPELDPARPATDFQLQQGLVLVRAMAAGIRAAAR